MSTNNTEFKDFISGYSIEVVPNSAAKIESFAEILPASTRVYIAHLENENIATMVATAKRIHQDGKTKLEINELGLSTLLTQNLLVLKFCPSAIIKKTSITNRALYAQNS